MPFRRRGSFKRALGLRPVDSNKNIVEITGLPSTTTQSAILINTVDNALLATKNQVERGCTVYGINLEFDVCGLAGTGVRQRTQLYLIKNVGANLTPPGAFTVGSSNEKKFVLKMWSFQTMRNQDGNPPFHVNEFIKLHRYKRMGAADTLELIFETDTSTGHLSGQCIYKWYK